MTNNRKIANSIFKELKDNGLVPIDIDFGNGYFVFSMGDDSVVHFHIKGVKGWKFGMWIDCSDSDEHYVQFFAQYEEFIDKFKPTASTFVVNISKQDLKYIVEDRDQAKWTYWEIIEMCKHIKYNPKLAFVQEGTGNCYVTLPLWKSYLIDKWTLYTNRFYKRKKLITEDIIPYLINKVSVELIKTQKLELIDDVTIVDLNTENWISSPRWEVRFFYKRVSDNDEEQEKAINEFIDEINKKKLFTADNTMFSDYVWNRKGHGSWERW